MPENDELGSVIGGTILSFALLLGAATAIQNADAISHAITNISESAYRKPTLHERRNARIVEASRRLAGGVNLLRGFDYNRDGTLDSAKEYMTAYRIPYGIWSPLSASDPRFKELQKEYDWLMNYK